ncbi:Uncharacterised protein [Vibrio cholerae]|nr:Uncharacterised protein [Vibrio cholerae]
MLVDVEPSFSTHPTAMQGCAQKFQTRPDWRIDGDAASIVVIPTALCTQIFSNSGKRWHCSAASNREPAV